MIWFLALHIAALVFWVAGLLLLPALIAGMDLRRGKPLVLRRENIGMPRLVFTRIATPAALLAITAGTCVFLLDVTLEVWLLLKLALVAGLVLTHTLAGLLILRAEHLTRGRLVLECRLLGAVTALLLLGILWTVLAKPFADILPYDLAGAI